MAHGVVCMPELYAFINIPCISELLTLHHKYMQKLSASETLLHFPLVAEWKTELQSTQFEVYEHWFECLNVVVIDLMWFVMSAGGCQTSAEKRTWLEDRWMWRNSRRWRCSLDR